MEKRRFQKIIVWNRKRIIMLILAISAFGIVFGLLISRALLGLEEYGFHFNVSLYILFFTIFLVILWLPMFVAESQISDIDEHSMKILPSYPLMKKWKVIGYILCNDTIEPFLRVIPFQNIQKGVFDAMCHASGMLGYSWYTYRLTLYIGNEKLPLYIDPIDNGIIMPSGFGGATLNGRHDRKDICNLIQMLRVNHVKIEDPYGILDALKDESVPLYEFLETLDIKKRY